ncbi:fatty-acid amide hydrolase 2-A-like [Uloborus diversus]|uniref:fatty-acid amide hydrolase 2-A-like n=1 Tax=Uloborus diversus TaxID=327109 RepID=UPI0024095199|nr:fatty-acid amide hydrolase 2-A-like [Uloborus diversus]
MWDQPTESLPGEAKNVFSNGNSEEIVFWSAQLLRAMTTLTRPFSEWIFDAIYTLFMGPTRVLPPITDNILLLSAVELTEKIRKKQITCEEVMKAYIKRVQEVEPFINSCVDQRFEEALKEAEVSDIIIASGKTEEELAKELPLLGVPFSCKEAVGVTGLSQTSGLAWAAERKCERDSEVVALYRRAGAIPLVVTNVPEMCMWWESANIAFGRTKNPYDHKRTAGGSSGGEGAILAAAGTPIGIGNDIAGSIRIPASFCGIYGHKPSQGLISNEGRWPPVGEEYGQFLSTGPMCRYVEDLPLLTKILSGDRLHRMRTEEKVDFRKVKIFYMEEFPGILLSATSEIKTAVKNAATHFETEYGVQAVRLNVPELALAFYMWECKLLEADGPSFKSILRRSEENKEVNLFWEFCKSLIHTSDHTWPALFFATIDRREKDKFYYKCLEMYKILERKLNEALQGDSILLVPTHPDPPPHHLMTIPKYWNIAYTCIFNILGFPSTQIPAGMSHGLPIGIQAIGRQYQDHLTLAVAVELDKVFRGWICPCPINV